jgi:PAS domain S-box-containing protein
LEAEAAIEPDRLRVLPGTDLSEVETVSRGIVGEVVRTRTQRILRDALQDDRFGADPYIRRHRSRSVFALPLVHKDELTGVLYLENELAAGAFTADRVEMMRLFSSQAAVFIQNALLYRQLAQSEKKYRSIFENAAEGLFRAEEDGRIIDINPAFFRMLGCRSREDCLCWLTDPAPADGRGPDGLRRLLREQKPVERMEMEIRRRDGGTFHAAVSAARVRDPHENRYFYEGTILDITAEKNRRSEEEAIAEERRRIAREIHDGVAQDLAFIRLRTAKWRRMIGSDPDRLDDEFDRLRDLLGKNIREVRRSIFALRPADLENLGFFPALERFFEDFREQMEIQLLFRVTGPREGLPAAMEPGIFRILQESLNNVAKHADADTAWVTLEIRDTEIRLTVADNGRGFRPADLEKGGRLGIQQMRERMHRFGGAFFLSPREGGGARVQAVFPVQKGDAT